MLFLLERIPESLYTLVGLKICICFSIFESHLVEGLDKVAEKKCRNSLVLIIRSDSDQKEIRKAIDALLRRGHSYGTIRRVLNGLSFDTDDFYEDF